MEIVDDEGKVRAVLGTDKEGTGGLSVYDASGRVRARLDAGEILGQDSGLFLFDTDGKPRAMVGMDSDPDKGSALVLIDRDGNQRAIIHAQPGGRAGLSISAAKKNRAVQMAAMDDGTVLLLLSGENAPMIGLTLREEKGKDPSSDILLSDKDGRAGIVLSGRRAGSYMRLKDRREKVRASFQLGANGVPELYLFDEEGRPAREGSVFERPSCGRPRS